MAVSFHCGPVHIVSAWDHVIFTHHVFLSHEIQQRAYIFVFRDLDVWYQQKKTKTKVIK